MQDPTNRLARRDRLPALAVPLALALLYAGAATAQHDHHAAHADVGEVDFPVSCTDAAQQRFEHALAMLHHMMYEQAEELFDQAGQQDPDCAMVHWGLAMSQLHPLWEPPTEAAFARGAAAVEQGLAMAPPTERERAHLRALAAYYQPELAHRERLAAWSDALLELHEAYPDDIDAAAFHALSMLATASPDDSTFARQAEAGERLEVLFDRAPEHPGLFHYLIHAYDNPELAPRGERVAREYDQLAPDVPHALHMPSHIFVRLGMWEEVAAWNLRSAEAALRQPVGDMTSMHHVHALDYLIYARLQQGRDDDAHDVVEQVRAVDNYQPTGAAAYGIAAAKARYPLERGEWERAAQLSVADPEGFPWERFPWFEAITHFARGLGAARSGDPETAREAVERLDAIHRRTAEAGEEYWLVHVHAKRTSIDAWLAHAEGRHDEALALMREAADTEDSVDKHPITPGAVLPARELLGEMLLLNERPADALEAFEASLAISPGRSNALLGAGRAAELAGFPARARAHYREALDLLAEGNGRRTGQRQAEAFLGSARAN